MRASIYVFIEDLLGSPGYSSLGSNSTCEVTNSTYEPCNWIRNTVLESGTNAWTSEYPKGAYAKGVGSSTRPIREH